MPIVSQFDCLKLLHHLEEQGEQVTVSSLAENLGIKTPSVTQMLRLMSRKNWVRWKPRSPFGLSDEGRKQARKLIRRHRVIETYLVEKVGLDLLQAHEEAENLEHAVSDDLVDRFHQLCGEKTFDPHGDPIPNREGEFPTLPLRSVLSHMSVGESATIDALSDRNHSTLEEIVNLELRVGLTIERISEKQFVCHRAKNGEKIDPPVTISKECLETIYVRTT